MHFLPRSLIGTGAASEGRNYATVCLHRRVDELTRIPLKGMIALVGPGWKGSHVNFHNLFLVHVVSLRLHSSRKAPLRPSTSKVRPKTLVQLFERSSDSDSGYRGPRTPLRLEGAPALLGQRLSKLQGSLARICGCSQCRPSSRVRGQAASEKRADVRSSDGGRMIDVV
jgi:hypothetical protein